MTVIDFSKLEDLPEGLDVEVLHSDVIQEAIKSEFDSMYEARFNTEASGLQRVNADLKKEKQQLKEHFDAFKDKYKDINPDEYRQLREFRESAGEAGKQLESLQSENEILRTERDAITNSFEDKLRAKDQEALQIQSQLDNERLDNRVLQGIQMHNKEYSSVKALPGTERWILAEARETWKKDENGSFVPMRGDRVLTGPDGNVMTFPEWVNSLRTRAEFSHMFEQPTGGGAPGSGKSGRPFNPNDLAGDKDQRTAAFAARFNLPRK